MTQSGVEINEIESMLGDAYLGKQNTADGIPTLWVQKERLPALLSHLKHGISSPYAMLYDLTAIDERERTKRSSQPASDFSVVYHLLSYDRNADIRIKVPLIGDKPSLPSISSLWKNANWYEREVFDMFGINFEGHPHMRRLLMPQWWQGHPLRKEHPARATEMGPFVMNEERQDYEQGLLQFKPEDWGAERSSGDTEFMFLNLGPQHPGTHGVLRIVVQLDGETIVNAFPEIGFHHRGAEKMAERQMWHSFIPYTDRIDYLGGVMNNLPYLLSLEQLAGIQVPARVQMIRVMLCEFFRISSHLVWFGTFAQDLGAMSAVFYPFNDRERLFKIIEGITGGRMHPSWFRIGGVAHDLPIGWDKAVAEFVNYFPSRVTEYENLALKNSIMRGRTDGIGAYTKDEAIEWGITGPGLRACGVDWDLRKKRPYSGYEQFEFEVPTATRGDCTARAQLRMDEMRQSIRIIEQCMNNMPEGDFKSDHPLTTPPKKDNSLVDIDTLINHFLNVTWGPVMPAGETFFAVEASKGNNGYYIVSDGNNRSYRTRIRTPSFPHIQMVPHLAKGSTVADLLAILGSIDFVLADLDR